MRKVGVQETGKGQDLLASVGSSDALEGSRGPG